MGLAALLTAATIDVVAPTLALERHIPKNHSANDQVFALGVANLQARSDQAMSTFTRFPHEKGRIEWLSFHLVNEGIKYFGTDIDFLSRETLEPLAEIFSSHFAPDDWSQHFRATAYRRAIAWCLYHHMFEQAAEIRGAEREHSGWYPTEVDEGRINAVLPISLESFPRSLLEIPPDQTPLKTHTHRIKWVGDRLSITGWAYIYRLSSEDIEAQIRVNVFCPHKAVLMEVESHPGLEPTRQQANPFGSYESSGFKASISAPELSQQFASCGCASWSVDVAVTSHGLERVAPLSINKIPARFMTSEPWIEQDAAFVVSARRAGPELTLQKDQVSAFIKNARFNKDSLEISGQFFASSDARFSWTGNRVSVSPFILPDGSFTTSIPLPSLRSTQFSRLVLMIGGEELQFSTGPGAVVIDSERGLEFGPTKGAATLRKFSEPQLSVQSFHLTDKQVNFYGIANPTELSRIELESSHGSISCSLNFVGNEVTITCNLTVVDGLDHPRPIPAGSYALVASNSLGERVRIRILDSALKDLPFDCNADSNVVGLPYRLRISKSRGLTLLAVPQRVPDEGPARQRTLATQTYPSLRSTKGIQDIVLFESSRGRIPSCNPAAILSELHTRDFGLELLWAVNDLSIPVPEGARPVVRLSSAYFEALARARFLVNNNFFPEGTQIRDGQKYLQTWHGTPLKRIGHDMPRNVFSGRAYMKWVDSESANWSSLISPNQFSSEIFPQAFHYSGTILETGYPRNDALVNQPQLSADRARRLLNLPEDSRVILYAPTWRDDRFGAKLTHVQSVNYLDFEQLLSALPADYHIVFRGHINTMLHGTRMLGNRVIDATRYPDIADLYCLADLLITDYSSVMFDFAVTGKPMVFLAPDIEDYESRLRGFYFDFKSTAPGPIVQTTRDVVQILETPDALTRDYRPAYEKFRDTFCRLEDGRASERVVDAFFT